MKDKKKRNHWYKKNPKDRVWWYRIPDQFGGHYFSFDKKEIFNLFSDYPYKLTKEEKEIFDEDNPFWADFFRSRTNE